MPEYDHMCTNEECNHEWSDEYSIKQDPPTTCPKCGKETAKRLISLTGKGVVELSGQDLINKAVADGKQIERESYTNENKYSNLIGESKYNEIQSNMDRARVIRRK